MLVDRVWGLLRHTDSSLAGRFLPTKRQRNAMCELNASIAASTRAGILFRFFTPNFALRPVVVVSAHG
jgi:hypothetical protein